MSATCSSFLGKPAYAGIAALAFVEAASLPIIPVTLWFDETRERWRKQPRVEWDLATTDEATIAGWWHQWPDALPGISLRKTKLVVVDADTPDAVEEMKALRMLGPHSKIATPNGGLHMVFAQPPEAVTKHRWCEGIEILGSLCLLTCYDLAALAWPDNCPTYRTKLRAPLPEMFRKPRGDSKRVPINKTREEHAPAQDAVMVAGLTDGLFAPDPEGWRGCHDEWLSLMNAAKWLGIAEDDFVQWSLGDPMYGADERVIRRKWRSLTPAHGGALYAALSAAGIKVDGAKRRLIDGLPLSAKTEGKVRTRQPTRNWLSRVNTVCDTLRGKQDADCLFWAGCRIAEVMIDTKKPIPSVARALLEAACPRLRKAIGVDEVRRIITNAFHEVEKEELQPASQRPTMENDYGK
jgi:hypothetical protein